MTSGDQATDEQALTREIERTRGRLGDTVEQLAAKADVKSLARAKAAKLAGRVKGVVGRVRQRPVWVEATAAAIAAATATGAAAAGTLAIWRRRHR